MLFHNENTNEGIESVMEEINKYVPYLVNKEEKVYPASQGVAGDQSSVERGINNLLLMWLMVLILRKEKMGYTWRFLIFMHR